MEVQRLACYMVKMICSLLHGNNYIGIQRNVEFNSFGSSLLTDLVYTRVVRKVLRHSLFFQKDRTSIQTTYMVTKYYIYVILG